MKVEFSKTEVSTLKNLLNNFNDDQWIPQEVREYINNLDYSNCSDIPVDVHPNPSELSQDDMSKYFIKQFLKEHY